MATTKKTQSQSKIVREYMKRFSKVSLPQERKQWERQSS